MSSATRDQDSSDSMHVGSELDGHKFKRFDAVIAFQCPNVGTKSSVLKSLQKRERLLALSATRTFVLPSQILSRGRLKCLEITHFDRREAPKYRGDIYRMEDFSWSMDPRPLAIV